jgi:hypothetical protein
MMKSSQPLLLSPSSVIVIVFLFFSFPSQVRAQPIETELDSCLVVAIASFERRREEACINQYNKGRDCDVTGRGTLGTALYENYFREKRLCLQLYLPHPNLKNVQRREKCLKRAQGEFETIRRRACIELYEEEPNCSVIGRGTFGKAIFDNYYAEQQFCAERFPIANK